MCSLTAEMSARESGVYKGNTLLGEQVSRTNEFRSQFVLGHIAARKLSIGIPFSALKS